MRCRAMVRGSDQPQTNRFRSLLTVSHVDRDPLGLGQAHDARRSSAVACTKISLPPRSGPTKPNPFMALYHFTLPSSSTVARSVRCNQGVPAESYGAVPVEAVLASSSESPSPVALLSGAGRAPQVSRPAVCYPVRCARPRLPLWSATECPVGQNSCYQNRKPLFS